MREEAKKIRHFFAGFFIVQKVSLESLCLIDVYIFLLRTVKLLREQLQLTIINTPCFQRLVFWDERPNYQYLVMWLSQLINLKGRGDVWMVMYLIMCQWTRCTTCSNKIIEIIATWNGNNKTTYPISFFNFILRYITRKRKRCFIWCLQCISQRNTEWQKDRSIWRSFLENTPLSEKWVLMVPCVYMKNEALYVDVPRRERKPCRDACGASYTNIFFYVENWQSVAAGRG